MGLLPITARRGVRCGARVRVGRRVRLDVAPGAELVLEDRCRIGDGTRIVVGGGRVVVGAGAVLGERCVIVARAGVTIGSRARLDDGAVVVDFDHSTDDVERPIRLQPLVAGAVEIGVGARVGLGAAVLRGVSVGAGATVEPHAVVTRDVAAAATVGGVPARPLR